VSDSTRKSVTDWPGSDEPELLERLAMTDSEFRGYFRALIAALPSREYGSEAFERAIGYPWERPGGSYRLTPAGVDPLNAMSPAERDGAIAEYTGQGERLPVLAIGSNGAPRVLERKLAHFPEERDRSALVLTGRLHDFDVGFAAQPALYGALPATIFPSPGTFAWASLLWVTPAQLTQLAWSELSYRFGRLPTRFETDEGGAAFDEVLVFVSRFGAFCVEGEPAALAAVPAEGRRARAMSQEEALGVAAELILGPGARAEALVRAIHEDFPAMLPAFARTVNRESLPFSSAGWAPFPPRQ
jgi:hypothetical protein